VFAGNNVPRVNNVNFSLRVGVAVPESVHVIAVPSTLIEIYPDWRDHYYFVTGDDIVIVDRGHKIVAVAPVGTGSSTQIEDRDGGRPSADHFTVGTDEIRQIQMALRDRGFTVEVDGVMGPQTKEALITFQRREGLVATGEVDQKTFASLRGSSGSQQNQTTGQQPSPSGQPSRAPGGAQPDNSSPQPNRGPAGMNNRPGNNSGAANPR